MPDERIVQAVREAIERAPKRNFLESVEVAVNLRDLDLKNPKNRINTEVLLPRGRGKSVKVAVIADGMVAVKAKGVADLVLGSEDVKKLAENKREAKKLANSVEYFIAEAPLMPLVGRLLGPILGPRGKMPKTIPPTADPVPLIERLRNTVRLRSKDKPVVHAPVGTRDMAPEDIAENVEAVLSKLEEVLPEGRKNIKSVYVKTTMGPAVRVW